MILLKRIIRYLKTRDWNKVFDRCEKVGKAIDAIAKAITIIWKLF